MSRPQEIVRSAPNDLAENELFFATLQEITSLINGGRAQETIFESVLDCALQMLHAQAVFLITVEGRKIRKYARRVSSEGQLHSLERYDIESQSGTIYDAQTAYEKGLYRGEQIRLKRAVAIKILRLSTLPPDVPGTWFLERFRREPWIIAGLNHPHIVQVIDCGEEQDEL
jgi:serine/threonine protein kinase